jgi:hypothetical protein
MDRGHVREEKCEFPVAPLINRVSTSNITRRKEVTNHMDHRKQTCGP